MYVRTHMYVRTCVLYVCVSTCLCSDFTVPFVEYVWLCMYVHTYVGMDIFHNQMYIQHTYVHNTYVCTHKFVVTYLERSNFSYFVYTLL